MPDEYLRSSSTDDVLWHLQLILEMDGLSNVGIRPEGPVESAVVVGKGRPGFRRRVAEAFAANGVDVLEARMRTRSDGIVVDSFKIKNDRTGGVVEPEKWDSFRADLEAGLRGEFDTGSKVATRAAAYETAPRDEPDARAQVDPASGDLVITIKCTDRIGRLAEILTALGELGLDIRLAKSDSRQGGVIDTFHVDSELESADQLPELERRIAGAIAP